jgi:drug/metabolite transporter (DMT)-like permease
MKRAMDHKASAWRVLLVSNLILALWAVPLLFVFPGKWDATGVLAAVIAGAALFAGRVFSVKALEIGDLSVVVPLLGMKTLCVAVGSLLVGAGTISYKLVIAAALASAGVALLQRGPKTKAKAMRKAILFAFLSSVLFAVTDVATQGYAKTVGIGVFQPVMLAVVCLMLPLLGRPAPAPSDAKKPLLLGSTVMGFQTTMVIMTIGLTGQATLVNILYSTRSLWSVLIDRLSGGKGAKEFLIARSIGAILLTAAVILAMWP